jgi:hypothetical protein
MVYFENAFRWLFILSQFKNAWSKLPKNKTRTKLEGRKLLGVSTLSVTFGTTGTADLSAALASRTLPSG